MADSLQAGVQPKRERGDMQFRGVPHGRFRDDARWNSERYAVEFTLDLRDDHGNHPIVCRVSWEALADAAETREPANEANAMRLFKRLKDKVHAVIDRKLKAGEFEGDDSILISSRDQAL